jgi:tRNA (cmo5U34)-methyltransferase
VAGGQFHLDASTYLAAVRAEVPVYDELQEAVAEATATATATVRAVLELGTGTGETARRVLARHPGARLCGVDASPEMLAVAAPLLPGADLRVGRLEDPLPTGAVDLVVAALVVHHLPAAGKRDLFSRVAGVLHPSGRFVLADVVVPDDPAEARTPLEAGVDLPDRLDDQLRWLAEAGFAAEVVWQAADLAVVRADLR